MTKKQPKLLLYEPKEIVQKIHPELNLEKWSLWRPSKSPNKTLTPRILERELFLADGSKLTSKVQVGFTEYGTLTTEDRKTYYALIKIWEDKGRPHGQVSISLRRLAKVLDKKWGTNVIDALTQSLLRLRVTPFTWEDSYYNADTKETEHLLTAFNILSELKIIKKKRDGHTTKEEGFFRFNAYILCNLQKNYTKPLYLSTLLKFHTEIAQLLYIYLDLIMANKCHYERKSAGLFQDLGLEAKTYRKPSVRKQKLEKALKELQGVPLTTGILTEARSEQAKDDKDFKIVFKKRSCRPLEDGDAGTVSQNSQTDPENSQPKAADFVNCFHQQLGRPEHQPSSTELDRALTLLAKYDEEQVMYIIDYAIREAQKTDFLMRSFGAILQYQDEAIQAYMHQKQQHERSAARQQHLEHPEQQEDAEQASKQLELTLEAERTHETFQAQFDALDPETQATLYAAAEQKLASHKARMTKDAYEDTLKFAILQEMQAREKSD